MPERLTPKQRWAMSEAARVMEECSAQTIGKASNEDVTRGFAEAVESQLRGLIGVSDAKTEAQLAYVCPEKWLEGEYPHEPMSCEFSVPDPLPWSGYFWRRLRMVFTRRPGRCPYHHRKLESGIVATSHVRLEKALDMVICEVKVG